MIERQELFYFEETLPQRLTEIMRCGLMVSVKGNTLSTTQPKSTGYLMIRAIPETIAPQSNDLPLLEVLHSWAEESLSELMTLSKKVDPSPELHTQIRRYEAHVDEVLEAIEDHPERRNCDEGW